MPVDHYLSRLQRLQHILLLLQTKQKVTGEELADYFQLSAETIQGDIADLQLAGFPIGSQAEVGYFLVEGFHLPPIVLNEEEAKSLVIAKTLVEKSADPAIVIHFKCAIEKVKSVIPEDLKKEIKQLASSTGSLPDLSLPLDKTSGAKIQIVQEALAKTKVIQFYYANPFRGIGQMRDVEPIGLIQYADFWHLIGWCRLRQDYRDFRLDKMNSIKILETTFQPEERATLAGYLEHQEENFDTHLGRIWVTKEHLSRVSNERYRKGLIEELPKDDGFELVFAIPDFINFSYFLLSFGPGIKIISPIELKEQYLLRLQDFFRSSENLLT